MAIRGSVIVLGLALTATWLPAPGWSGRAAAQSAQSTDTGAGQLTAAALEQLVGRIALYPDDLLSVVLPAATQPLLIVEAQRFLGQHQANKSLKPPSTWDPSVVALLNYPDVLSMMDHDLNWTQQLGDAVVSQQADVLNAIQTFRKKVYDAGNLTSNDKQSVKVEDQAIVVQSADPQTIYVPQYNPQVVVAPVAVGAPAPYYYSQPYPYYASPAATFATGAVFGAAVGFAIGWGSHGIYTGNWGGYYGGGNVNVNRNVNVNNTRLTDAQRAQFNNRVTQNRENAWRPDRNAIARQQASLGTRAGPNRVNAADIRSGLANSPAATGRPGTTGRPAAGGGRPSPQTRPTVPRSAAGRSGQPGIGAGNRAPGAYAGNRAPVGGNQPFNQGGGRPGFQQSGGAFGGYQSGAAANRYSNRGAASLRSSNHFAGSGGARVQGRGGGRPQGGGGSRGGGGRGSRR